MENNTHDIAQLVCSDAIARMNATVGNPAAALAAASAEALALSKELAELKVSAKQTKAEIADWKAWWDALPEDRAQNEISKREMEISRLAARLGSLEEAIVTLCQREIRSNGAVIIMQTWVDAAAAHGPEGESLVRSQLLATMQRGAPDTKKSNRKPRMASTTSRSKKNKSK